MARNTRQQRRARRRENAAAAAANAGPEQAAAPESTQPARPAPERARERRARDGRPERAPKPQAAQREPRKRGSFVRESWAELNKVEWPGRSQVIAGTVAVIIACVIVGAYLWVADLAIQRIVERVLI